MGEAQEFYKSLQGSMGKYHKDLKKFVKGGKGKNKALSKAKKK